MLHFIILWKGAIFTRTEWCFSLNKHHEFWYKYTTFIQLIKYNFAKQLVHEDVKAEISLIHLEKRFQSFSPCTEEPISLFLVVTKVGSDRCKAALINHRRRPWRSEIASCKIKATAAEETSVDAAIAAVSSEVEVPNRLSWQLKMNVARQVTEWPSHTKFPAM